MSEARTSETVSCPHCGGSGQVKRPLVTPWGTWKERLKLARQAKAGDRWIQIKSGRLAVIVQPLEGRYGSLKLKHENGRTTIKWHNYFAQEFTPDTPPLEAP